MDCFLSMFLRILGECQRSYKNASQLAKALGADEAALRHWKKGHFPQAIYRQRVENLYESLYPNNAISAEVVKANRRRLGQHKIYKRKKKPRITDVWLKWTQKS